jgi:hypothetical protein
MVTWKTKESIRDESVYIERDVTGLWLWQDENTTSLARDTTLPELLTVCRVLGIPLEVEGDAND